MFELHEEREMFQNLLPKEKRKRKKGRPAAAASEPLPARKLASSKQTRRGRHWAPGLQPELRSHLPVTVTSLPDDHWYPGEQESRRGRGPAAAGHGRSDSNQNSADRHGSGKLIAGCMGGVGKVVTSSVKQLFPASDSDSTGPRAGGVAVLTRFAG